jgi:hypothetical protein
MSVSPEDLPVAEEVPAPARPKWVVWAATGGVIVLVAAGFFGAKAISGKSNSTTAAGATQNVAGNGSFNQNGTGGRGTGGTIATIDGNTLTIKDTANNTQVKVVTSGTTRVTVSKTIAVADIAVGDRILVTGTKSANKIAATRIADMGSAADAPTGGPNGGPNGNGSVPAGGGGFGAPGSRRFGNGTGGNGTAGNGAGANGGFTIGTVDSVSSGTIVVSTFGGTKTTVTTTPATTVTKNVTGTLGDLKVGDTVRVGGTTEADGSVTATSVNEGSGGFGGFGGFRRSANGTPATNGAGG